MIGPTIVEEQPLEIILGAGLDQTGCAAVEGEALNVFLVERPRQPLDNLLHEWALGGRVETLDITAQLLRRLVDDRLRHEGLTSARHAVHTRDRARQPREDVGVDRDRWHAGIF